MYLRLLTSAQIRADPTTYQPFLSHPDDGIQMEPPGFCENFVESIGKEAGLSFARTSLERTTTFEGFIV
jgi:ubiquitin thioesterase protein OTUB1